MPQEFQDTSGYEGQIGQQQHGDGDGGSVTDYEALISQHRQTQSELQKVRGEFDGFRKRTEQTEGALDRIRKAIAGDEEKQDPRKQRRQRYEGDMDMFLSEGLKADRQGRGIPLTTKLGTDFYQYAMEKDEEISAYKEEMAEMKRRLDALSSPDRNLDTQAGVAMEGILQSALATVYGDDPSYQNIRDSQFDATSRLIVQEIKNLQRDNPEAWNRIRRNPTDQRKLVAHFVKQNIPPKARELLEEKHIQDTPMTEQELWSAWGDLKERLQQDPQNPQLLAIQADLRAELLQHSIPGGKPGRQRGTANRMMSGY